MAAARFYVVERSASGISLNNANETVRLFDSQGKLVSAVSYGKSVENEAYARGENGKWFWTTILTPGQENIISVFDSKSNGQAEVLGVLENFLEPMITTLDKIKECEAGDLVKVRGTVAVEPGILGAQYFYIVGSPGVQVYNYKKEFPSLKVGDYIEVSGEISLVNGEQRLKTKQKEDMEIIERRQPPVPEELTGEKVSEEYLGGLISVTGEVTDKKGSDVYLDDGTGEVRVYIKKNTGIDLKEIIEGETITVVGIVSQVSSGLRIMPRADYDIIRRDEEVWDNEAGQILGEVAASDEWSIEERDQKMELFRYLLILAGGIIIVLAGLLFKELKKKGG